MLKPQRVYLTVLISFLPLKEVPILLEMVCIPLSYYSQYQDHEKEDSHVLGPKAYALWRMAI